MNLERMFEPIHPGEYELKCSLRENGYEVKDVSNDVTYFNKDIDLIATNIGTGAVTNLEVKWDKRIAATGNLFIEIENPRSLGGNGWFKFCQADMLAYGDAINKKFYFFRVAALKKYIEAHEDELEVRKIWDGSKGYLLPLLHVEHLLVCAVEV